MRRASVTRTVTDAPVLLRNIGDKYSRIVWLPDNWPAPTKIGRNPINRYTPAPAADDDAS